MSAQLADESAARTDRAKYRVFVSYSREDRGLVEQVVTVLRENNLDPMWDEDFAFGQGFHQQIKNFIAHAHVFLPVLTKLADQRKWVHEEIGFAIALNIPVLPVAIDCLPGEMIGQIQAISVSQNNVLELRNRLTVDAIRSLVDSTVPRKAALYSCTDVPQSRATAIAQHSEDVLALGRFGKVRQKGGFSSFHLPTESVQHRKWKERYDPGGYNYEHCLAQRSERLALTRHSTVAGCKLIIIPPSQAYVHLGNTARASRLRCLREFLLGMDDETCQVATCASDPNDNLLVVGNWFVAESVSMRREYRQTIFTRHAPTVTGRVTDFDAEFNEFFEESDADPFKSRCRCIDLIDVEIANILAGSPASTS
jgi:hypothetical protein